MEVKNVILICLLFGCVAFNSVQSASFYYRNGREIEIPVENEIIREEIVSELRKEPEVTAIETEPIAAVIKEEIIVPVDQLRIAAPAAEVQEPVAVVSEKEESNDVVDETIVLRSANAETLIPVVVEEKLINEPTVAEPGVIAVVEKDIPQTKNEPLVAIDEQVPEVKIETEQKETPVEVVVVAVKASPVEEPIAEEQENVVVADETPADRQNEDAPAPPTSRPTVIQAIQTNFQNLQQQIQSVFNPNAAASSADASAATTARPPGFIAQFQQAVGNVFNRPAGSAGPFQGFVSTVQNNIQQAQTNFQGLFQGSRPNGGGAGAAPAVQPATTDPVVAAPADPVNEKIMLDNVPVVNVKIDVAEKVEDKVDEVKSD